MSDLVAQSLTSLPVTANRRSLKEYGQETDFLPRIQLYGRGKAVETNQIRGGNYGTPSGEDIIDLGSEIDILPFAIRDKALDTSGEKPVAVYDPDDPLFQDIEARSKEKNSGCMYGPSLLVLERNTGKFYEWFLGNKSARIMSDKLEPFLPVSEQEAAEFGIEAKPPTPCTVKSKYVTSGEWSWYVPIVFDCSVPFDNLPEVDVIVKEVERFVNPPQSNTEVAEEGGRSR